MNTALKNEKRTRFPLLEEVVNGQTTDVYFERTKEVLEHLQLDPIVGVKVFSRDSGVLCGMNEAIQLLRDTDCHAEVYGFGDGKKINKGQTVMAFRGKYSEFGVYETAILGILSFGTGKATAAKECVDAAIPAVNYRNRFPVAGGAIPVISFGARHNHPNVAAQLDYASIVGGCQTGSTPLGAALAGKTPGGTMPHALMLVIGDTLKAAEAFDEAVSSDIPRIVLVDTFQDECVETLRLAREMGDRLHGVRLDTPSQRGGVTPGLVAELRARLQQEGFEHVKITISGGLTPERIVEFCALAQPDAFGVGSYISGADNIDFTADIREVDGRPIAKRGRIPGMKDIEIMPRLI